MRQVHSCLTLLMVCALGAAVARADFAVLCKPPQQQIDLRLYDAMFRGETPNDLPSPLILLLRRTDDGWQPAWGTARGFNHNVHCAWPSDVELTDQRFHLDLEVSVFGDARGNTPGVARYTVELARNEDDNATGRYKGKYAGTWRGVDVTGEAEATILSAAQSPPRGFKPLQADEHPRIRFRKSDLPDLRKKAGTPLGVAALKAMDGPVGLALKYQLTGNRDFAHQAIPLVEKLMERGLVSDQFGNNVGDRLEKTALAYDMCFDTWPADFKRKVELYMLWSGNGILRARRDTHQAVNWHVASNWSAPLYTGAGFAGLALFGRQGPPPPKPLQANTGAEIDPAENYKPGRGVPVFGFKSDEMSPNWILASGFKTDKVDGDPLADLGGVSAARPQVGDRVEFGGKSFRFAPVPQEKDKGYWQHENYDDGKKLIDITNAVGRDYFSTTFFFAVLRNDKPRWVRFEPGLHRSAVVYLNGVRLAHDEVVHIKPGLYPMLVQVYIDQINPWGRQLMRPRLVEITADEAKQLIAERRAQHERTVAAWQRRKNEWEELGGLDLRCRDLFEQSRHMMYLFCREAVGSGGFQAELTHYSAIAEEGPARYMGAHLQMLGYHVSPQQDMELLLPRKMFAHVYPREGEPRALEINGSPNVVNELFAALLPVVRDDWQPVMLWGWQRHAGFDGRNWLRLVQSQPSLAMLNYPLDMQPAEPASRMPLTWRADDFGFYGMRNRWRDGDDFVFQFFARAHYIGGWNSGNAGTFRLVGLGHNWAVGSTDRNRHRREESVVQLPDDRHNHNACALVTYIKTQHDGSGVVSIDYTDVYSGQRLRPDGRKGMRMYSRYGNIRQDEAFIDLGIRGMRSIGVDYSGRSGAPCLVAVVDRVQGGGRKVWTWQLPKGSQESSSDVQRTTTDGNSFTVRKDDGATLHGVFASGQRPVAELRMTTMTGGGGSTSGKTLKRPIPGVFAESRDKNAGFFFVGTIQPGDPPDIRVSGKSLAAVVTVGKQRVRFDGQKIVFEPGE